MIRKAIIIVLTLAAVASGLSWGVSRICFEEDVYDLGPWSCIVSCPGWICFFQTDDARRLSVSSIGGDWTLYYSEEVAAYTSEEQSQINLGVGLL